MLEISISSSLHLNLEEGGVFIVLNEEVEGRDDLSNSADVGFLHLSIKF